MHLSNVRPTLLTVNGVRFDSEAREGFTIPPDGLRGWTDPVASEVRDVSREGAPGSFALPTVLGSRLISVSGLCHASSPETLNEFGHRLAGLGADGEPMRLVVKHAGQTHWVDAYRGASHEFNPYPALHRAQYAFDFWCPDPLKYGELREYVSTGSNVTAWHRGNFHAAPLFKITGFVNGYRIVGPGGTYTVEGPKASSTVDEIDFSTGMFTRGGVPSPRAVTQAHVWGVPPGTETTWRVEPLTSGTGQARMFLTDTSA